MTEIEKLDAALTEMNIGHEHVIQPIGGGDMIIAYGGRFGTKYLFDAICNEFSYGGRQGLLEVMGKWLIGNRDVMGGSLPMRSSNSSTRSWRKRNDRKDIWAH